MKLTEIKSNPNNPRVIKDHKFEKLKKSISEFPKMMELRPMVINEDNIVLGGNMRLKALKDLGYKEVPEEWVKRASDLTDEETRRFIIADNVGFGEHDWDMLANDWDSVELDEWGLDVWQINDDISNTNDYEGLDVESKLEKFLDAKIKNLTIPFESNEFDEVILKLEIYLDKYKLIDYKEFIYKILKDENL